MSEEKYIVGAKLCKQIYKFFKNLINEERNIRNLNEKITTKLNIELGHLKKMYKRSCIAFPVSISLNNCVGNYINENNSQSISDNDLIKIEFAIRLDDCVVHFGETLVVNNHPDHNNYIKFLDKLENYITSKRYTTNDEIRQIVEAKCTEMDCFPVENSYSYQFDDEKFKDELKYMVFNYTKYYDEEDNLVCQNSCFELEEGEVYHINLSIIKNNTSNLEIEHYYKELHKPHIYRFNNYYYNLKLKSSKEFLTRVKKIYGTDSFDISKEILNSKDNIGIKECLDNGILDAFPVLYAEPSECIYSKKFTVIIKNGKCKRL